MTRTNQAGAVILSLVVTMFSVQVGYAQKPGCTDIEGRHALDEAETLRSWDALYKSYKVYRQCDDGTVEGYGANIRLLKPKDLQRHFVEDIRGTAIDHLGGGLFEAHGRDEAGWDEEAGHRDMWFAARDIAFDRSCQELDIEAMLTRMGFGPGRPGADAARLLPDDIPHEL